MQYEEFDNERPIWGVVSPREGGGDLGLVRDTIKKEQVIKWVLSICQYLYRSNLIYLF